jgi:hypothetical protein
MPTVSIWWAVLGGTKALPTRNADGQYHINGELIIADKQAVKDLTGKLVPLIRTLCSAKKLFVSPLSRYWRDPCCSDPEHLVNYNTASYLPRLGASVSALRDLALDYLYTRHTPNLQVICPNTILGINQRKAEMSMEDARELAAAWGTDPVHLAVRAYKAIAEGLIRDLQSPDARYTNPLKGTALAGPYPAKRRLGHQLHGGPSTARF